MALHHFQHRIRLVRLGGVRIGPLHLGGGWYRVGPLSVLRVHQLLSMLAQAQAGGSLDLALLVALPAASGLVGLRSAIGLLVLDPVSPAHLRRIDQRQAAALFDAVAATNDVPYILESVKPKDGKPVELDRAVVAVARELGLGDPAEILAWPYQQFVATIDALDELAKTPSAEGEIASEDKDLAAGLAALGFEPR